MRCCPECCCMLSNRLPQSSVTRTASPAANGAAPPMGAAAMKWTAVRPSAASPVVRRETWSTGKEASSPDEEAEMLPLSVFWGKFEVTAIHPITKASSFLY